MYTISIDNELFEPKEDITPMESVRLSIMFALLAINSSPSMYNTSWKGYKEKYNLSRHFVEKQQKGD